MTDSEQSRSAKGAAQVVFAWTHPHVKLDPVGTADKIAIIIGGTWYGLTFFLADFCWLNWKYRPIHTKNLPLTTLFYFMYILWFIGDVVTSGNINVEGAWAKCKALGAWVRIPGSFACSSALLFRVFALGHVFNHRKPCMGMDSIAPVPLLSFYFLVFCSITQVHKNGTTVKYDPVLEGHVYVKSFRHIHYQDFHPQLVVWSVQRESDFVFLCACAGLSAYRFRCIRLFIAATQSWSTLLGACPFGSSSEKWMRQLKTKAYNKKDNYILQKVYDDQYSP
ncbi:hypothetical protein DL89DRAFT_258033 [Linderina pennispora]|uniref:Transmembrane protein n=1 Tax=Linderina pennispora TaxID=61395 RepID=A0A1Y1W6B6_9FUNG|nr:uncharacterized protein DL89DRAFT_258033 [Linderina pennispora]ORX68925.1 hypothetical protein DL89DRAFT_258033 [Linderina pennispora]